MVKKTLHNYLLLKLKNKQFKAFEKKQLNHFIYYDSISLSYNAIGFVYDDFTKSVRGSLLIPEVKEMRVNELEKKILPENPYYESINSLPNFYKEKAWVFLLNKKWNLFDNPVTLNQIQKILINRHAPWAFRSYVTYLDDKPFLDLLLNAK